MKRLWPETIISGFFYLLGFTFVVINLLDVNNEQISHFIKFVLNGNLSLIGILSAAILGGSYLFGSLAGRLMVDIFGLIGPPLLSLWRKTRTKLMKKHPQGHATPESADIELVQILSGNTQVLAETLQGRYWAKYFYRSMLGGILFLVIASAHWGICSPNPRVSSVVWIIGTILWLMFLIAFFTQRASHSSLFQAMKKELNN